MAEYQFNPFEDRLSRDIRNDLSEGLAKAIETGNTSILSATLAGYRQQPLADCYREYLEDRFHRYQQALEIIGKGITDPIHRGLILWNLGLFFEVHEVLEHAWYSAKGRMKLTLQALIRSAGVYIKREYGFHEAADRIAAKAVVVLEANTDILQNYFPPEELTKALQNPDAPPPKLTIHRAPDNR